MVQLQDRQELGLEVLLVHWLTSPRWFLARLQWSTVRLPHLRAMTHQLTVLVEPRDYPLSLRPRLLLHSTLAHMLDGLFLHEALVVTLHRTNAHRLMRRDEEALSGGDQYRVILTRE